MKPSASIQSEHSEWLTTALPQVLIRYLQSLALQSFGFTVQYFVLEPAELGGRALQRITHHAGDKTQQHLVFGFEPLSCVLEAWPNETDYALRLCRTGDMKNAQ